jgi:hypothetical protein
MWTSFLPEPCGPSARVSTRPGQLQADAFLAVVKRDKGRFAQALAELEESENLLLTLPPYLSEALAFVARRNDEHDQSSQPSDAAAS